MVSPAAPGLGKRSISLERYFSFPLSLSYEGALQTSLRPPGSALYRSDPASSRIRREPGSVFSGGFITLWLMSSAIPESGPASGGSSPRSTQRRQRGRNRELSGGVAEFINLYI